jgi:hypothetical protein
MMGEASGKRSLQALPFLRRPSANVCRAKPGGFAYLTRFDELIVSVLFRNLTTWRIHDLPLNEKDKLNNALR